MIQNAIGFENQLETTREPSDTGKPTSSEAAGREVAELAQTQAERKLGPEGPTATDDEPLCRATSFEHQEASQSRPEPASSSRSAAPRTASKQRQVGRAAQEPRPGEPEQGRRSWRSKGAGAGRSSARSVGSQPEAGDGQANGQKQNEGKTITSAKTGHSPKATKRYLRC